MEVIKPGEPDKIWAGEFDCKNCGARLRVKRCEMRETRADLYYGIQSHRFFYCEECGGLVSLSIEFKRHPAYEETP